MFTASALKRYSDFQYPQSPLKVLLLGNLGHLMTFYPAFLTTFPSSRFRISYFLPLRGLQDLQYKSGFSSKIMHKLAS